MLMIVSYITTHIMTNESNKCRDNVHFLTTEKIVLMI